MANEQKQGTIKQLRQVFRFVQSEKPVIVLYMIGALVVPIGAGIGLTIAFGLWLMPIVGALLGVLLALIIMSRFADKIGFDKLEGQPGAASAILSGITTGGWSFPNEPVAIDPKSMSMVFRGTGRPGVVLVGEGQVAKTRELLQKERKRIVRVLPEVKLIVLQIGDRDGDGFVTIRKLRRAIVKNKTTLNKGELDAINTRLKALGAFKPPIPKGIDPYNMKVNRRALR
ncbi:MAG: DUF4191 domain-containing protein [Bifidobacteriaceae bacterium]|nr:DUF4191 domain-containing protein [Bifidobacteriaceae bacterium]